MKLYGKVFFAGIFLLLILILGCASQNSGASNQAIDIMEKNDAETNKDSSAMEKEDPLAGKNDGKMMDKEEYKPFTKEKYVAARSEGKIIFLEFYANWCPYCIKQKPINESLFASGELPLNVVGFQVNYKDNDTDADEEALAKEFNITYQHTRVIIDSAGSVSKKTTGSQDMGELLGDLKSAS